MNFTSYIAKRTLVVPEYSLALWSVYLLHSFVTADFRFLINAVLQWYNLQQNPKY